MMHELTLSKDGEVKVLTVKYDSAVAMFKLEAEATGWKVTVKKVEE